MQVNINLGSNIFDFSIWALSIAIGTKKTLKVQKTNECKKFYNINKSKKKRPNFEKVVSGRLPISLTANRQLTTNR
jgi:hypothetical protein